MAWTTPRTWVAGNVLTAGQLNIDIRDNFNAQFPLGAPAWTSYTPTLTQSGAVTKTVSYAKYTQIGKSVEGSVFLSVTGAGTANNPIVVGAPVTAALANLDVGVARWFNAGSNESVGLAYLASTTSFKIRTHAAGGLDLGLTGSGDGNALANTDTVSLEFKYEAA